MDGIYETLPIPLINFRFSVGYTLAKEEFIEVETRKKNDCDIPKPIPKLYKSFVAKALEPGVNNLVDGI